VSTIQSLVAEFSNKAIPFPQDAGTKQNLVNFFNGLASFRHMGYQVENVLGCITKVSIPEVREHHLGGRAERAINGAVISGILDCAMSVASFQHHSDKVCGTVSLTVSILRPIYDDCLVAYGSVIKRSRSMLFGEAMILDKDGRLCADCKGIVAVASEALRSNSCY